MPMARQAGVIRAWAWLDLVVTALLAVPPLAMLFVQVLYALNGRLGGAGVPPDFAPVHWFFVCLAGVIGVAWSLARILQPLRPLGIIDAFARLAVSVLILYFVLVIDAPVALLVFLVSELIGAGHQFWAPRRRASRAAG
jgi:asparagine N-glycosylation enzyme membrane subunit Stt3